MKESLERGQKGAIDKNIIISISYNISQISFGWHEICILIRPGVSRGMRDKHLEESKMDKTTAGGVSSAGMASLGGTESSETLPPPRPYVEMPNIEKLFEPHGVYDGKMFYTGDKVTYTFIDKKEVVSLHFDKRRQAIFYRGHNIVNLSLTDDQKNHLERFARELEKNPHTHPFVGAYAKILGVAVKR